MSVGSAKAETVSSALLTELKQSVCCGKCCPLQGSDSDSGFGFYFGFRQVKHCLADQGRIWCQELFYCVSSECRSTIGFE